MPILVWICESQYWIFLLLGLDDFHKTILSGLNRVEIDDTLKIQATGKLNERTRLRGAWIIDASPTKSSPSLEVLASIANETPHDSTTSYQLFNSDAYDFELRVRGNHQPPGS